MFKSFQLILSIPQILTLTSVLPVLSLIRMASARDFPILDSSEITQEMKAHFSTQIASCQNIVKDGRPAEKVPNAKAVLSFLKRQDYVNQYLYEVVYFQRGRQVDLDDLEPPMNVYTDCVVSSAHASQN